MCRYDEPTDDARRRTSAAEKLENLSTCLAGTYRALCRYNELTPAEMAQTKTAERRENLRTCLAGERRLSASDANEPTRCCGGMCVTPGNSSAGSAASNVQPETLTALIFGADAPRYKRESRNYREMARY